MKGEKRPQRLPDTLFDGRLTIRGKLGGGGEADTYLAYDAGLDREVVLKVRLASPEQLAAIRREARTLMQVIPHSNLQLVRYDMVDGDRYALVSDYIAGMDLGAVLASRGSPGLPVLEVCAISIKSRQRSATCTRIIARRSCMVT